MSQPDLTKPFPQLSIRIPEGKPDHHLWSNHGIWFVHYTQFPDSMTKQRVRKSLGTRDLREARRLRDELFAKMIKVNPGSELLRGITH